MKHNILFLVLVVAVMFEICVAQRQKIKGRTQVNIDQEESIVSYNFNYNP